MRALPAALLACGILAAPAGAAETPRQLLDGAAEKLVKALEMMLTAIPQYAAPEINGNGDIIIRRIHPERERRAPAPDRGRDDSTRT